ncbi:hypothetical protein [Thermohalobacter berrensis]|uniref:Uncharacterized protein n=1 Tax=Thermohalobacter berrensis TaxID=99594 RepID=A0A419T8P8_9FIRM|nr:hypothetical protein [Thermohalobacter berrensis]RKD33924.1 hypothetical protein BET03_08325 [Thermohalobacter berrensis]
MIRQTVTALVKDKESYYKVRKFIIMLVGFIVFIFSLFILTGGSKWFIKNIMGLKGKVLNESITILTVFLIFPLAVTLRNFMQGVAIIFRRTPLVSVATVCRVIFVLFIALIVHKLKFIPAAIIAGGIFVGAISVEGLMMFLGVKLPVGDIPNKLDRIAKNKEELGYKEITNKTIIRFFLPLVLTSFIKSLAKPIINSGLARTHNPEIALSTYAVAWGLGIIIVSPVVMFHQVPLNLIKEDNDKQKKSVLKFAIYLGLTLSVIFGTVAFSPIGYYVLKYLIGTTDKISLMSIDVLKIMSVLPLIMVIRQYYWGILMKKHMTEYISKGKVINLIALILGITFGYFLQPSNSAIIGIIGMISSELFESIYLYVISRNIT